MSTKDSNNRNKRGSEVADCGDQHPDEPTTKRRRCSSTIVAAPPSNGPQQQQQRKERIAELERQQKASDDHLALLDRQRLEEERHRKGLEVELAALLKADQGQQDAGSQAAARSSRSSSTTTTNETATKVDELKTLERLEKDIMDVIQSKKDFISQVQAELAPMERRLEKVEARIVSVKERSAKEERLRRRHANNNPRINEFMHILNSGGTDAKFDVLLTHQFPDLIDNVDFYWMVLDEICEKEGGLAAFQKACEILWDKEPPTVLNDKELMLCLCCSYPLIYGAIPPELKLKSDSQILEAVLARNPYAVSGIPAAAQLENPRLIGEALAGIPLWPRTYGNSIKGRIAIEMWRNRDVVLGWAKGGGDLHYQIPQNLREDEKILEIALDCMKPAEVGFPSIPMRLRANKGFMLKAVESNYIALSQVDENLRGDRDLALAALSGTHGHFSMLRHSNNFIPLGGRSAVHRNLKFWAQMGESIRKQLRMHDSFVELVLGSIDLSHSKPSALAMLDHGGHETVVARKKLIAEFAGIPIGDELAKLRKARRNLAKWGLFWCD